MDAKSKLRNQLLAIFLALSVLPVALHTPTYAVSADTETTYATPSAEHAATHEAPTLDSEESLKNAKATLEKTIEGAKRLLDDGGSDMASGGKLKASIEHAGYAVDAQRISGVESYDIENAAVEGTVKAVKKELDAYRAEQARIAAQARARATGGTAVKRSDGTWTVNYRGTDDRRYANADGSMSEWKSGYYIAHDWSANGQAIASKPGTVRVNGRLYRYVSSMVVPRGTTWGQVSGFVYANDGIGFQTCYGDGYLITHYELI